MSDRRPDLRIGYLEHHAMRTDAARLIQLVDAARPSDSARLTGLTRWYAAYEGAIHDHHRAEDMVVYPALLDRDASFADAEAELDEEHHLLADRLAVGGGSPARLAGALRRVQRRGVRPARQGRVEAGRPTGDRLHRPMGARPRLDR